MYFSCWLRGKQRVKIYTRDNKVSFFFLSGRALAYPNAVRGTQRLPNHNTSKHPQNVSSEDREDSVVATVKRVKQNHGVKWRKTSNESTNKITE